MIAILALAGTGLIAPSVGSHDRMPAADRNAEAMTQGQTDRQARLPVEPKPISSDLGWLVFDNGTSIIGSAHHYEGAVGPNTFDRTVVDDFVLTAATELTGSRICGLWWNAPDGAPGPVDSFRVRIWNDAGNEPAVGEPFCDLPDLSFTAFNTGVIYSGRAEVCYDV